MLRHSRAMTRHHRERVISNKKNLLDRLWFEGYHGTLGKLSKWSSHRHSCSYCSIRYNRAKEKQQFIRNG